MAIGVRGIQQRSGEGTEQNPEWKHQLGEKMKAEMGEPAESNASSPPAKQAAVKALVKIRQTSADNVEEAAW